MKFKFGFCWFCLFLFAVLAVLGAGIITKYVCPGDSVQAFQNIRFNKCSSVISLYINDEGNTLIARWSFENCSQNVTRLPEYNDRVFLYSNGTVSINNVHHWDQAKYIVNCQMGNIFMKDVVEIKVMAAPANDCIQQILHKESSLFVSLKAHSCGKPVATVYWKRKGYDFLAKTEPVLKLHPGNQDGTYYACIEGPALTCVKNALDYCSNFTIGDKSPPILLETWDAKMAIFFVVGIVSGVSLILATVVILIRKRCRQRAVESGRDDGNVHVTFGENEGRTDGREVKDKNSVPGSSRAIIRSDDQSDDFPDAQFMSLLQMEQNTPTRDATSTILKGAVENGRDDGNVHEMFGENEGRTDGREVKDKNSVPGSSRAIIRSDDQSDDFPDAQFMPLLQMDQHPPTRDDMLNYLEKHEILEVFYDTVKQKLVSKKENVLCMKQFDSDISQEKQPVTINPFENAKQMRELQTKE